MNRCVTIAIDPATVSLSRALAGPVQAVLVADLTAEPPPVTVEMIAAHLLGDRVLCDGCGSINAPDLELGGDGRLLCTACRSADDPHTDHELIAATGRRQSGSVVGWLICVECAMIVQPLPICGAPTRKGRPCRVPIRMDLGYTACWSHGEGAGRTSTRKRRAS
jgi:hypothetical protein